MARSRQQRYETFSSFLMSSTESSRCSVVTLASFSAADDGGDQSGSEFTGRLVISNGTVFTEELLNTNSAQFKALAYDTEQKVHQLFSHGKFKEVVQILSFTHVSPNPNDVRY